MKPNPNSFLHSAALATASTLALTLSVSATDYQWDGSTDSNWQDPSNWAGNATPAFSTSDAHRLNVNSSTKLLYTSAEGTTVYANAAGRGLVIGSGGLGNGEMEITGGSFSTLGSASADIIGNSAGNSGTLTINGGTFIGTDAGTSLGIGGGPTSTLNVMAGKATLANLNLNATTATINLSGTGELEVNNISRTASITNTASINFDGGTLRARGNTTAFLTGLNSATVNNGGVKVDSQNFDITIGQALVAGSGTGGLTKQGGGTLILTGNNSYQGTTTIDAGELRIGNASGLGSSSSILVNAGRLSLDGGITTGSGKTVTINGDGGNFYGALQGNSGTNVWQGNVTIGSAFSRIGVNSGQLTVSGVIDSGANNYGVTFRTTNSASSILVLSGANTYLGDTTIITSAGNVRLSGGDNRLPTATKLLFGASGSSGILDLNGQNQEVAGLTVVSGANNEIKSATAATLTVNTTDASTFAGKITGAVALTKEGASSLTLSGINTYSGMTKVNNGQLLLNTTGGTAVAGDITLTSNSSQRTYLRLSQSNQIASTSTLNMELKGTGAVYSEIALQGNSQTLAGINATWDGTVATNSRVFIENRVFGDGGGGNGVLTINGSTDSTWGEYVMVRNGASGTLGLVKEGAGTLTIGSITNDYTGATTVSAGTLLVTGALGDTAVSVGANGIFGGSGSLAGSLSLAANASFHVVDLLDPLSVSGSVSLDSTFGVDDLVGLDWGTVADGTYTLINGTATLFGSLGLENWGVSNAFDIGGGRSAYFQEGSLQLVVIPEPSAALLGSFGLLALFRRRRAHAC